MSTVLYPYDVIENGVLLSVLVNGESIKGPRTLIEDHSSDLNVRLIALLPRKWKSLFCTREQKNPPVGIAAQIVQITGRQRTAAPMKKMKENLYAHDFVVPTDRQRGVLEVSAVVYRDTQIKTSESGKTPDRGARLTWSEPVNLVFEQPKDAGSYIEIKYLDFSEAADLKGHFDTAVYSLALNQSFPILYLNEASDYLYKLFNAKDGTKEAGDRDVAFAHIATSVWSELLLACLAEFRGTTNDDPASPGVLEELSSDWQRAVIEQWASRLYPELSEEDANDQIVNQIGDESFYEEAIRIRLPMAAQQTAALKDALEKFAIRVLTNE